MEKFCKDLREHTVRIVSYEKKEMIPLTGEENKFMNSKKSATYVKNDFFIFFIFQIFFYRYIITHIFRNVKALSPGTNILAVPGKKQKEIPNLITN